MPLVEDLHVDAGPVRVFTDRSSVAASHITGAGIVARTSPVSASVNVTEPSLFAFAFIPSACSGRVYVNSVAAGISVISTNCSKPVRVASTITSAPGTTSW
ncbi:hypothetical protein [Streptomyces sp. NPDC056244]|uniref:hypothetical protein n=1 Tax=Streptomyces sp. NPDC056244 TaxID=3345762 RepID=UPI0035DD81E7